MEEIPMQNLHHDNIQQETTYLNPQQQQQHQHAAAAVLPYHVRNCMFLTDRLLQMKTDNLLSDLVFEIHDQRINAHRCVVAAWSPYLYNHLNINLACMEIVRVHYDNFEIFTDMVSFMYTGKIDLRDTNLIQLLHLATSFQIDTLREVCEGTLRCNLHEGNIVSTFYVARKFKLESLEEYAMSYLQMHLPEAVKQADFLNLSAVRFNTFLSTGWMVELKPEVKLFLIISWLGYDVKEREQFLVPLLQHIDWSTVAGDFLLEISQTENFFTTNESSLFLLLQTLHSSEIDLGSYTGIFPSLRQKYSYLLNKVVENSVLQAKEELYYPVSISVTIALVQANDQLTSPNTSIQIAETTTVQNEQESRNATEQSDNTVNSPVQNRKSRSSKKDGKSHDLTVVSSASSRAFDDVPVQEEATDLTVLQPDVDTAPAADSQSKDVDTEEEDQYYEEYEDDDVQDPDFVAEENQSSSNKSDIKETKTKNKPSVPKPVSCQKKTKKTYQCTECEYSTVSEARYEDHRKKSHSSDKVFSCHLCDFTCSWSKKFNQHMLVHYYGPPYQCEHEGCNYSSDTIRSVLVHRVRHTDQRPYPCDQCEMRFRTRSNLCAHRKCHQGEKPWKCPVCEMSFATKSTLSQHSVRHSDDRPYLCDKCGFGTKFQSHLIAHKRIHSGDVFRCQFPQCSYFAPKQSQLKSHMRTHLGIRKFTCEECDKSFVEKSHLVRHQKIHLEEKPYSCSECGYSSTRKDKLKEHIQKRHDKLAEPKVEKPEKKRKKKSKKGVKTEPRVEQEDVGADPDETVCTEESIPVPVVEPEVEHQHQDQPQDLQLYPQMVPNAQYLTTMEPVLMDQNPQGMVVHAQNVLSDGQLIGHPQYHTVGPGLDPQQVTVVMDARVHAQLNPRSLVVDPQTCMSTGMPSTLQAIGQANPADGSIVYTVPTTTQTVVMATPQQDYSNIGSYYSFVMNNEGQ